jgi:hypothetical protein
MFEGMPKKFSHAVDPAWRDCNLGDNGGCDFGAHFGAQRRGCTTLLSRDHDAIPRSDALRKRAEAEAPRATTP